MYTVHLDFLSTGTDNRERDVWYHIRPSHMCISGIAIWCQTFYRSLETELIDFDKMKIFVVVGKCQS